MKLDEKLRSEIQCPQCLRQWAWLGDHGQSILLHGRCLVCLLITESLPEVETDAMLLQVVQAREQLEKETGRRVLPCPHCMLDSANADTDRSDCQRCAGRGWVLGYPPGSHLLTPAG